MILDTIPLQHLSPGQTACIRRLIGRPESVRRLEEFGLRPGVRVEMFRSGNPCIIRLGGCKLCLRADDVVHILVEPSGDAAPPCRKRRCRWRWRAGER